ncbi:MAG: hypothetical protein AAF330_02995, partial [Pseudomonadota bacterium]
MAQKSETDLLDRGISWLATLFIRSLLVLPYRSRMRLGPYLVRALVAPGAGYSRRARENIAMIFPELPERQQRD